MPVTPEEAGALLREQIEANAGASFVGPDARSVEFSFDNVSFHQQSYLTIILDGFASAGDAHREMLAFAVQHPFPVLGNPVRLHRNPPVPGAIYPQGPIMIWRGGHTPLFGVDADGVWSVQMTYCVLPPFARVASAQ
jgi:hypothetical protein